MQASEALERILKSYVRYYDINRDTPLSPFAAEAEFHSVEKGYFLSKRAVTSESESNEYIFFYTGSSITADDVNKLSLLAWEDGMKRVEPHKSHRNSDVTVILIADSITPEAFELIKKLKFYKSYKMTFNGWSNFRIVALESSSGALGYNRRGSELKKVFKSHAKSCREAAATA